MVVGHMGRAQEVTSALSHRQSELDRVVRMGERIDDLEAMAEGWRQWGASEDGWFTVVHGEILGSA